MWRVSPVNGWSDSYWLRWLFSWSLSRLRWSFAQLWILSRLRQAHRPPAAASAQSALLFPFITFLPCLFARAGNELPVLIGALNARRYFFMHDAYHQGG